MKSLQIVFLLSVVHLMMINCGNPVGRNQNMKCGECIYYGYNICLKDKDHPIFEEGQSYNSGDGNYNRCYD